MTKPAEEQLLDDGRDDHDDQDEQEHAARLVALSVSSRAGLETSSAETELNQISGRYSSSEAYWVSRPATSHRACRRARTREPEVDAPAPALADTRRYSADAEQGAVEGDLLQRDGAERDLRGRRLGIDAGEGEDDRRAHDGEQPGEREADGRVAEAPARRPPTRVARPSSRAGCHPGEATGEFRLRQEAR